MTFSNYSWLSIFIILPFQMINGQTNSYSSINQFIQTVESTDSPFQIEADDLSEFTIQIYWINTDRRYTDCFVDRLESYIDAGKIDLEYRWTWPTKDTQNSLTIFVIDPETEIPDTIVQDRALIISAGKRLKSTIPRQIPSYSIGDNYNGFIFDLLAQYLFKGIRITEKRTLATDTRLSFLSPGYMGLDSQWLNFQLDSILQSGIDSMAYPGAEIVIVYKGSVIYQKSIGYHSYDKKFLVRDRDLYDLASVTKVTAGVSSLMSLYDNGEFHINEPLKTYFPFLAHSNKGDLSMKRVLTHSAGLKPYMVYYKMAESNNGKFQKHTLSPTRHGEFSYPITDSIYASDKFNKFIYNAIDTSGLNPGNKYVYSGLSFLLFPDLVKTKTGNTIDQFLYTTVYEPMGAHKIKYNPLSYYPLNHMPPTEMDNFWRNQLVRGKVHDEAAAVLGGVSTNAGLFSNALDLAKLGETWRRKGTYGGRQYWETATLELFTKCGYCEEGNRRALGFDRPPLPKSDYSSYMSPLASQSSYGHSGFTGTMIWIDPEYSYTFVFLSNRVHPTRSNTKLYSQDIRSNLHSVLYEELNKKSR
ncbi:serine hydrolase domain-containing protein [Membranihabitans maritimus]|uniref:serine hydrolase domain-containing protein n=1 Tax=Membranihabitans maritimus TaxID=2904244 RepID=UPI001F295D0F|nr:serine hydrolase [Membranihabitans maritimus]